MAKKANKTSKKKEKKSSLKKSSSKKSDKSKVKSSKKTVKKSSLKKKQTKTSKKSNSKTNAIKDIKIPKFKPVEKTNKQKVTLGHSKYPRLIGFVGGVFSLLVSIWFLIINVQLYDANIEGNILSSIGIVAAGLMIYSSMFLLKSEEHFKQGSTLLIASSILAIIPGGILFPVIGLIGGIMSRSKKFIEA